PAAGYKILGLPVVGLQRKLTVRNLSVPFKLLRSINRAKEIVKEFNPEVVIGVGGYASAPTLRSAASLKIPTLIQEQNSYPGVTNKLLSKKTSKICVAYEGLEAFFPKEKIVMTGNPVRQDLIKLAFSREEACKELGLDPSKKIVLSVGGSLGARTINESILGGIDFFKENDIQVIWQTGKWFYEKAVEGVSKEHQTNIKIFDFISRMDLAYAAADIIISRAGAIAISELCLVGKPTILIPSPNVSEDHQTKNALALVNKGAAIMVSDMDARNELIKELDNLLKDSEKQASLSENCKKMGIPDATERIVDEVIRLVKS
ncbi:undecaprenyldiphospho-muramoylpentapeptide beta-N-acetylglucosaminyltransferase, partial [Bacteroidales bacterium OttesenSCG-928-C19]|nr:undecaprenyldiphospho-muramoylpentapeptide beta-N-acetylglucosaminyltransferase [Bacteroidales bacterium OttesenSCG-928-C19]